MKKLLLVFLLLSSWTFLHAQNRVTIKGTVADTAGTDLSFATVMLLNPSDSTLVNFTRADDKASFTFKNVKNIPYLLKISYVGYIPFQKYLPASTTEVNDLGALPMRMINTELSEVVIKAARSTLSFKGDTIEYDAASFKVPPGSTVEDLLRRLPGIDVDADGNIKAQGRDVNRVYVDGKTFFGDDPKAATKNLGAETISKVQVYNEKSDQAQLTGVDDGKREKALNLELKEEFKKGSFGKMTVAGGTEDRWASRGNYNRFNSKEQFSIIGYGNNINETGVNWEDYGEFKGQSSFSDRDNGDFGFRNGGGGYYIVMDGDGPMNYFDGRGFTENYGGGMNYNFDNKKTKYNASYFYNETELTLDQTGFRNTFTPQAAFLNTDTLSKIDFRGNHSLSTRLEHNIDSNNVLIVRASGRYNKGDNRLLQDQLFYGDQTLIRGLEMDNKADQESWRVQTSAIYRHKFKKKGRTFAASAGYNANASDGQERLQSLNRFFEATTFTQQVQQLNQNQNGAQQIKSSLLFTEPINKKWFWETFFNYSDNRNLVTRRTTNPLDENKRVDSLSVWFDNQIGYQRAGTSVRFSHNGANISAGLAAQQIRIGGKYAVEEGAPLLVPALTRDFSNIVPYLDLNYEFANNTWVNASYTYSVKEPSLTDLQPMPNVTNPAFRVEGNPNLTPARSHDLNAGYGFWNSANQSSLHIGGEFQRFENQITYNQTIEVIDSIGFRTTSRPENISGGFSIGSYLWGSFPLIKTKLTANISGNIGLSNTPSFVNSVRNETSNQSYGIRPGLNLNLSSTLILGASADFGYSNIKYSIQTDQNQEIYNYGLDGSLRWQLVSKTFLESNLNYQRFKNERFNFDQSVPIWNASIRRIIGKANRIELRLAAFDILNRRVTITQNATQNYVVNNVAGTLARYYMLSASYNLRGYEIKLKKNNHW